MHPEPEHAGGELDTVIGQALIPDRELFVCLFFGVLPAVHAPRFIPVGVERRLLPLVLHPSLVFVILGCVDVVRYYTLLELLSLAGPGAAVHAVSSRDHGLGFGDLVESWDDVLSQPR